MDVADSYKRMSGNGREKKTGSLSESAVRFLTRIGLRFLLESCLIVSPCVTGMLHGSDCLCVCLPLPVFR